MKIVVYSGEKEMKKLTTEIKNLKGRLSRFLKRFESCIKTAPSRGHMATYVAGQVGSLERKNMEAMALDKGTKPRTLQAFNGNPCPGRKCGGSQAAGNHPYRPL